MSASRGAVDGNHALMCQVHRTCIIIRLIYVRTRRNYADTSIDFAKQALILVWGVAGGPPGSSHRMFSALRSYTSQETNFSAIALQSTEVGHFYNSDHDQKIYSLFTLRCHDNRYNYQTSVNPGFCERHASMSYFRRRSTQARVHRTHLVDFRFCLAPRSAPRRPLLL